MTSKRTKRSSRARMTMRAFNRSARDDSRRARYFNGGVTTEVQLLKAVQAVTAALLAPISRRLRRRKTQTA